MKRAHRIACAAVVLLLAGCVTPPPEVKPDEVADATPAPAPEVEVAPAPPAVVPPPPDDAARALSYFDRVRRMPSADLTRELETMKAAYGRTHDDADRVRLAMLFALPNSSISDDARALELLEPIAKTPTHALQPIAVLLSTYVQEQRRLGQHAQTLQKEVQTLQQKLDALRSLERALSEREGAAPRRR